MRKFLLLIFLTAALLAVKGQAQPVQANENAVKELFFEGMREKFKENYVAAAASFNKIITMAPANDAVLYELAAIHLKQNKLPEAETSIKKAIEINPENEWYYRLQGEIYKRTNNIEGLSMVFDKLIGLMPGNEDYYYDKANALFLTGNTTEALKFFDTIEEKFGPSAQLSAAKQRIMIQAKITPGDTEIKKLLSEQPADLESYLYLSSVLLKKDKKQDAIDVLLKARTIAPESFEISLALADVYKAQKDLKNTYAELKKAFVNPAMPLDQKVKIVVLALPDLKDPQQSAEITMLARTVAENYKTESKAFALYGDVLYKQNNLNEAKEQYLAAIKLNDQIFAVWEQLLGILVNLGEFKEAIKIGDEALTIYPNQAIIYYYMAFAQHRTGLNDAAIGNIKYALQLDADNKALKAMTFALQGEIFIDQNKLSAADEAFDKAVALDPQNIGLLNNYAYYLALRDQNLSKAATLIAKAAGARPNDPSIAHTYAFVLFKMEKYDQAKNWIDKALENNEGVNPVYFEHLGDILFLKGDKEQALLAWQRSKAAGNDSEKLKKKINEKKYIK